jgi:hypothetical protein
MQPMIKRILWVLLLASGLQTSWAYSLGGPIGNGGDKWQIPTIDYGIGDDLNAPKNLGEEYRRNTPVMFYAFNANFLDFFGPEGAASVDRAYATLNVALTNVDAYSKTLTEVPLQTRHVNYQAQALGLVDLKSETLSLMVEQLGLADPVRYSWTLHDRFLQPNTTCPSGEEYLVVQRNFDFTSTPLNQLQYSPYVNDILYSYTIFEHCTGPNPLAGTTVSSVDPLAEPFEPIASSTPGYGDYFTGLTRDDIAGIRYLLTTNNVNWETPASDSLGLTTNLTVQQLFPVSLSTNGVVFNGVTYGTASYGDLLKFASTNDPTALQAAFPGLQFTLISNYFANVTVTNVVSYFTNAPGSPLNSPTLVTKKVPTTVVTEFFTYHFDNIITNIFSSTTVSTIQTITVQPLVGSTIGSPLATNITSKKVTSNIPSGEFSILPANSPCGLDIISTLVTFTNYTTNVISFAVATNNVSGTNSGNSYAQIQITPSIAHVYVIHPVTCTQSNAVTGLYRGIGGIKFVRADFDSLLGQFWQPITNDYSVVMVTNSKAVTQHFRRIVTQPDFLFSAEDLAAGPATPPPSQPVSPYRARNLTFNQANVLPGLAGPGTITSPSTITLNKVGTVFFNTPSSTMDGSTYFNQTPGGNTGNQFYSQYFIWASFDGTTNTPVVFPNGTSIDNLQNQIVVQASPASLPLGTLNQPYFPLTPVMFTATGGAFTQPFTWTENGGVLNGIGLTLNPDGTLSGTPTKAGTFDFILTLTDVNARSVQWIYSITIQPQ